MKRVKIVKAIQKALQGMSPAIEVKLFGSEARGDSRSDSDIDLLILVDKEIVSTEDELSITDPLYKIELETGVLINPFILPKKIWGKVVTPFYENVMKEGIALL
ncbi:nucleotidyltransferase domain-containing protein [Bacteroides bouchesdurhonensis]